MRFLTHRRQPAAKALDASVMLMATSTAVRAPEGTAMDWRFGAVIYGWFPSISGDLRYSPPGSDGDIDVSADTIIGNLQFTFMGSFEAQKLVRSLLRGPRHRRHGPDLAGIRRNRLRARLGRSQPDLPVSGVRPG